jgi:transcriptional regulator with XRE-family HTH domain
MSPEQCRAARAWLNWSQNELAAKAKVSNSTLRDFEAGRRMPIANNFLAIRRALEEAGIQFLFSQGDDKPWGVAKGRELSDKHDGQEAESRPPNRDRPAKGVAAKPRRRLSR